MYRTTAAPVQPLGLMPLRDEAEAERFAPPYHRQYRHGQPQQHQLQHQQTPAVPPPFMAADASGSDPEMAPHHEEDDGRQAEQEFFGVDPLQVMEDVINVVETYLCEGLDSLEEDVLATSAPLLKKADSKLHQRMIDQIREGVDGICTQLQPSVAQHMDSFEEQVLGRILRIPPGLVVPGSQFSVFSPQNSALPHSELFVHQPQQPQVPAYPPPPGSGGYLSQGGAQAPEAAPEALSEELLQQQEAQLDAELAELAQRLRMAHHRRGLLQAEQAQLQALMGDMESNDLARLLRERNPLDGDLLSTVTSHVKQVMLEALYLQKVAPRTGSSSSSSPSLSAAMGSSPASAPGRDPDAAAAGGLDSAGDDDLFYNFDDSPGNQPLTGLGLQGLSSFGPANR